MTGTTYLTQGPVICSPSKPDACFRFWVESSFWAKITSYHAPTFEDTVILVHDIEMRLEKLGRWGEEAHRHGGDRGIPRRKPQGCCKAVSGPCAATPTKHRLRKIFLRGPILEPPATPHSPNRETACHGVKSYHFPVSDSKRAKPLHNFSGHPAKYAILNL